MAVPRCIFLATLVLMTAGANARQLLQESDGGVTAPKWDETPQKEDQDRRSTLGFGQSTPVSVTFYNTPGSMDCADALGQCGYGSDVGGPAMDGNGGKFVANSLYPLHAASGNFEYLGGCGACGILSGNGVSKGYVITDVTDHLDSLDRSGSSNPPQGSHIDICLKEFQEYVPGTDGNHGGIFTGSWTRVDCSTMGGPNYPSHDLTVRYEAYNGNAKAVVVSRAPGAGVITGVTFVTTADNNGGHSGNDSPVEHPGSKVDGWGAWWTPGTDLSGRGGVRLVVTMEDGQVITQDGYPMPDFRLWKTGDLISLKWHAA